VHLGNSGACLSKASVNVEAVAETEDSEDAGDTDASVSSLGVMFTHPSVSTAQMPSPSRSVCPRAWAL
jgi:hypothetical protein